MGDGGRVLSQRICNCEYENDILWGRVLTEIRFLSASSLPLLCARDKHSDQCVDMLLFVSEPLKISLKPTTVKQEPNSFFFFFPLPLLLSWVSHRSNAVTMLSAASWNVEKPIGTKAGEKTLQIKVIYFACNKSNFHIITPVIRTDAFI